MSKQKLNTDCSLFYQMEISNDPLLKEVKEKIIQAMVSFEHFRGVGNYQESDKLRKLLNDFNIRVQIGKDNRIFYYTNEQIFNDVVTAGNTE